MRVVEIYKRNQHETVVILSSSVQIAYSCKFKKKKSVLMWIHYPRAFEGMCNKINSEVSFKVILSLLDITVNVETLTIYSFKVIRNKRIAVNLRVLWILLPLF